MRFVWAVVSFLIAAGLIGAGAVQLATLSGPETITDEVVPADAELAYAVVDRDVLIEYADADFTIAAEDDDEMSLSYGRTVDVAAWLSDVSYNHVTLREPAEDEDALQSRVEVSAVSPTEAWEGERATSDPRGADLWSAEETAEGMVQPPADLEEGMSLLIATDGDGPAFSTITTSYEFEPTAPWSGPLIVGGGVFLLIGLVFWIAGFLHLRRRRGPRRKGAKPASGRSARRSARGGAVAQNRSHATVRRAVFGIPAVVAAGAVLAGCTPHAWPDLSQTATPAPTEEPDEENAADVAPPALTDEQADRIVDAIRASLDEADEANDPAIASERMTDGALAMRTVTYELRAEVEDYDESPMSIPDEPVSVVLPQANDGWPRTALVVVSDEESAVPTVMTMSQESPWADYRVTYLARIGPDVKFPALAPRWMGGALIPPDSAFLEIAPQDLAAAYADVMGSGADSDNAALFDLDADFFLPRLQERRDDVNAELFEPEDGESAEETAEIHFDEVAGGTDPVSLATFDSGAIVAVTVDDWEEVVSIHEDGEIMIPRAETQHFVGVESTEVGVRTTYTNELFFFVPAGGSDEKIRLLAYSQALANAELLDEPEDDEAE